MTLIDHTDDLIYDEPSIFKTNDVLPPDLIRGPKGDAKSRPVKDGPEILLKKPQKGS